MSIGHTDPSDRPCGGLMYSTRVRRQNGCKQGHKQMTGITEKLQLLLFNVSVLYYSPLPCVLSVFGTLPRPLTLLP